MPNDFYRNTQKELASLLILKHNHVQTFYGINFSFSKFIKWNKYQNEYFLLFLDFIVKIYF